MEMDGILLIKIENFFINKSIQLVFMQPEQKKKINKPVLDLAGLKEIILVQQRQYLRDLVQSYSKQLNYKNKDLIKDVIAIGIKQYFIGPSNNDRTLREDRIEQILPMISRINSILKQSQVVVPIVDVINQEFIQLLSKAQKQDLLTKNKIIQIWQNIPFRNLEVYINSLQLYNQFRTISQEKYLKFLVGLINDNKIQSCCTYYKINPSLLPFQEEILTPKLLNTDQIFRPHVINLLKSLQRLKLSVVRQIDLSKAVTLLEHLSEDPTTYEHVLNFILRKHYKSMEHQYQQWPIFEDKMSFNPLFLKWYCEEKDLNENIRQSIKYRNGLQSSLDKQIIMNPFYKYDFFGNSEQIEKKIEPYQKKDMEINKQDNQYLTLSDFGLSENNIYFINDSSTKDFELMVSSLSNTAYLGFDAEYRCTSTKYQQQGVALIQMSTGNQIFLIDFLVLEKDEKFLQFFSSLLSNPKTLIIGHSIQGDIKYIERTMKIQNVEGLIDIVKLFKEKFPNEVQTSLPFITHLLTGKYLSKYEQRSNWNRRPLKKTQIHYAALDAQICLILFEILKQQDIKLTQAIVKSKKPIKDQMVRNESILYQESQQGMLNQPMPKFLVDSMLKRLCSLLRNLGIDTEYISVTNFQMMQELAKKQRRIILTRDKKLLSKKFTTMPIYCITQKGDSDLMLLEVKNFFKLDFTLFTPLSRCVKCNNNEIQLIQKQQAMKYVTFQYQDSPISQFWICVKCKQVYWEGNQWKNAKKKFEGIQQEQSKDI